MDFEVYIYMYLSVNIGDDSFDILLTKKIVCPDTVLSDTVWTAESSGM